MKTLLSITVLLFISISFYAQSFNEIEYVDAEYVDPVTIDLTFQGTVFEPLSGSHYLTYVYVVEDLSNGQKKQYDQARHQTKKTIRVTKGTYRIYREVYICRYNPVNNQCIYIRRDNAGNPLPYSTSNNIGWVF